MDDMYASMYIHAYIHTYSERCIHRYTYAYLHTKQHTYCTFAEIHPYIHTYLHKYVHACLYVCAYKRARIYPPIHPCNTHMCKQAYKYAHTSDVREHETRSTTSVVHSSMNFESVQLFNHVAASAATISEKHLLTRWTDRTASKSQSTSRMTEGMRLRWTVFDSSSLPVGRL
jgi:hypothetical protein